MADQRKTTAHPTAHYLERAKNLSALEIDALRRSVRGRFERRRDDQQKSAFEILALQLEYEASQLTQWRRTITKIRNTRFGVGPMTPPVPANALTRDKTHAP